MNKKKNLVKTITEVIGMNKNKKLAAAFTLIFTAAATMAGAYALGNFTTNESSGYVDLSEVDENKTAQAEEKNEKVAKVETKKTEETGNEFGMDNVMDATDEYKEESSKSAREEMTEEGQEKKEEIKKEEQKAAVEEAKEETAEVMSMSAVNESSDVTLNFSPKQKLSWPVSGNVIMNYSMENTIYFATLDQYKYNPALIIGCETGDSVKAAANGKITAIETLDETGITVTLDMGNGYTAVYGQLKDVTKKEGDTCKAGEVLGSISDPSRYYLKEGSNLYFKLQKDGATVNPLDYLN